MLYLIKLPTRIKKTCIPSCRVVFTIKFFSHSNKFSFEDNCLPGFGAMYSDKIYRRLGGACCLHHYVPND
jgi:hypothetical protein